MRALTILGFLLCCSISIFGQSDFKINFELAADLHKNFGSIDTYKYITDGYSSSSLGKTVGVSFQYKTVGLRLNYFGLDLNGPGFSKPYNLIESSYDNFPRQSFYQGGGAYRYGYSFEGGSFGVFKTFQTPSFDVELEGNYALMNVNLNSFHKTSRLFYHDYYSRDGFTRKHIAYYDKGSYFDFGINIVKRIWKGFHVSIGTDLRSGSFKYYYYETIEDTLYEENNKNEMFEQNKKFSSFGVKLGLRYQLKFSKE